MNFKLLTCVLCVAVATNINHPTVNEVFINPGTGDEFIELWVEGSDSQSVVLEISNYALLILSFDDDHSPFIIRYIQLGGLSLENVESVNFVVLSNSDSISNTAKITQLYLNTENGGVILIRKPDNNALAILGLRGASDVMGTCNEAVKITPQMASLIKNLAVDGLLFHSASSNNNVGNGAVLGYQGESKLLPVPHNADYSLGKCLEKVFHADGYWYALETPGILNTCVGAIRHIFVNDGTCNVAYNYANLRLPEPAAEENLNPLAITKWLPNIRKNHYCLSGSFWNVITTNSEITKYVSYIENPIKGCQSSFRCESCYRMYRHPQVNKIGLSGSAMTADFVHMKGKIIGLHPNRVGVSDLGSHITSPAHINLRNQVEKLGGLNYFFSQALTRDVEITGKKLGLVYLETKVGLSLKGHEELSTGLKSLGFDTGDRFNTQFAANRIVKFISSYLHEKLIEDMINNDVKFSFLLDSSTDVTGRHGLLLMFMFIESGRTVVKVWRYVEATDCSAAGLFNLFVKLVTDEPIEGFPQYFKTHVAAASTDGAANMIAETESFIRKLKDWVSPSRNGATLQSYHCGNHRLALAFNDVVYSRDENLQFCKKIIEHCNLLARFYGTRSYKKRASLSEQAEEMEIKIKTFKPIKKARWVPAIQSSFRAVNENFKVVTTHLENVMNGGDFIAENRQDAHKLFYILTDRNFVVNIFLNLDVIAELSKWTTWMERKGSSVIDIWEWRNKLVQTLETMLAAPGTELGKFFQECKCDGRTCNEETYETATSVIFRGKQLRRPTSTTINKSDIPSLSHTRPILINAMLESVERRFPLETMTYFSYLNPKTIETVNAAQWRGFTIFINRQFGFSLGRDEFQLFQRQLVSTEFFRQNKEKAADVFWSEYFMDKQNEFHNNIKEVIEIAMIQPAGTATVEGAFSVLNSIKTKQRSSLRIETVEHIMRIKFNGMKTAEFPKYDVAREWISKGHLPSESNS